MPQCWTILRVPSPAALARPSRLSNRTSSTSVNTLLAGEAHIGVVKWSPVAARQPPYTVPAGEGCASIPAALHSHTSSRRPAAAHTRYHSLPHTDAPKLNWTELCSQQRLIVQLPATLFYITHRNSTCRVNASQPESNEVTAAPCKASLGQVCAFLAMTPRERRGMGGRAELHGAGTFSQRACGILCTW